MEQLQIYVNLLHLLDYQLKELLKLHVDTYVTLNTHIYVYNLKNTLDLTKINERYEIEEEIVVTKYEVDETQENELQHLLFNDVDSETEETEEIENITDPILFVPQENEEIITPLVIVTPITLNPYIDRNSCFINKPHCVPPSCIPPMYKILPNTKDKRDRKNKKPEEEIDKKSKSKSKSDKCIIM
jgi:hypothetical protein